LAPYRKPARKSTAGPQVELERKKFLKRRRTAERDLKMFVRAAWPILEPTTPLQWNWHLDLLCAYLTAAARGDCRRLIINVPPRSMKSLLCTVFYPVWRWCTEPQRRFMFVSYSDELSTDHSLFRRNVLNSEMYRGGWGHLVKFSKDQNLKTQYENTRRGVMFSTSITGSATGKGCDELIVDDPMNAKRAFSDQEREATNRTFDATFRSRLNNPATGTIIVIMQRLHDSDLTGHLLAQEPEAWKHIKLPAEAEEDERWPSPTSARVYPRRAGELLWPARFSREVLAGLKIALGSWSYAGQYQQNPAPLEGGIVQRKWIQYYRELPVGDSGRPTQITAVGGCATNGFTTGGPARRDATRAGRGTWIQSWDCSFKDTREADYVVGQVWLRMNSSYYLVDQVRERMDFIRTKQAIQQMTAKYPQATAKLIEDKANGPAVIAALRSEIDGIIPITPTDSKMGRLHAVSPLFEAGNVFLPEATAGGSQARWVGDFIEELTRFPNAAHDDQVDACTQALMYMRRQGGGILQYYKEEAERVRGQIG
jgi:predicted phage terminase large subunit-like protein